MQLGLAAWHRYLTSGSADLLADLVAEDAVFHSPVTAIAQNGHETVVAYLLALGEIFDGASGFRYVREFVDGSEACLEFEAEIEGIEINGVHLIRFDIEGRIVEFKVMVRPENALSVVRSKMAAQLQLA